MNCKTCSAELLPLFETEVLKKYQVKYFQCTNCGFIQTEKPFWLEESYSDAIGLLDVGLAGRNIELAELFAPVLHKYFGKDQKYLDYGGGYGLFVRLMRDKGLNFYRQDLYCDNIFAQHFDLTDLSENSKFSLVTAFEVFEHLVDPIAEIEKMFNYAPSILFSTELQPKLSFKSADEWWYFSTEAGQHISLYTLRSLEEIATKFGKNLYSNGKNLHLLTDKNLSNNIFKRPLIKRVCDKLFKKQFKSLLQSDFDKLKGEL
jgi:Methyltransferase domain